MTESLTAFVLRPGSYKARGETMKLQPAGL